MTSIIKHSKEWGLNPGEIFPDLKLKSIEGEDFVLFDPSFDTLMIIFSSVRRIPCQELNKIISTYQSKNDDIKIVVFMKGSRAEIMEEKRENLMDNVIVTELTEAIMRATETQHCPLTFLVSTGYDPAGKRKQPDLLQKGRIMMKGLAVNEEHLGIIKSVGMLPRAHLDIWY